MLTIVAHMHDVLVPVHTVRPEVPAALSDVIARCLAKKPEQRFSSVTALEVALHTSIEVPSWSSETAKEWWRSVTR